MTKKAKILLITDDQFSKRAKKLHFALNELVSLPLLINDKTYNIIGVKQFGNQKPIIIKSDSSVKEIDVIDMIQSFEISDAKKAALMKNDGSLEFYEFNANPMNKLYHDDSVVRAVSLFIEMDYKKTYEVLSRKGLDMCENMNHIDVVREVIQEYVKCEECNAFERPMKVKDLPQYRKSILAFYESCNATFISDYSLLDIYNVSYKVVDLYFIK